MLVLHISRRSEEMREGERKKKRGGEEKRRKWNKQICLIDFFYGLIDWLIFLCRICD